MMVTVPLDIVYDVMGHLASPPTDLSYTYDAGVVGTLASLCRVDRTVGQWATARLYSRLTILSSRQLALLVATGMPHRMFTRSLVLLHGPSPFQSNEHVTLLLTMIAPTLEQVMLHDGGILSQIFGGYYETPNLSEISYVAPSLRRAPLRSWLCRTPAKSWDSLRRLALNGVVFNEEFFGIRRFRNLKCLVIRWSLYSVSNAWALEQIIDAVPWLKRLIMIYPPKPVSVYPDMPFRLYEEPLTAQDRNAIARKHADRLSIVDFYPEIRDELLTAWFSEHVRLGTIWSLPGRDWLSAGRNAD